MTLQINFFLRNQTMYFSFLGYIFLKSLFPRQIALLVVITDCKIIMQLTLRVAIQLLLWHMKRGTPKRFYGSQPCYFNSFETLRFASVHLEKAYNLYSIKKQVCMTLGESIFPFIINQRNKSFFPWWWKFFMILKLIHSLSEQFNQHYVMYSFGLFPLPYWSNVLYWASPFTRWWSKCNYF